ncbi:MAG: zinc ABC transporter substrate-binding protein [Treponema sp.]|nr:zinc ABC transporter substrate-binding protein [Treponema sp.]
MKNVLLILFFSIIFSSCLRQEQHDGILIAVSIPPQEWFVSQIAGDKASVLILVPPGQNPHNYEPTPRQIQSLANASAWILSGTEFEIALRPKIEALFPDLLIIDGTEGVNFRMLLDHEHHDCDHDHSSLEIDRHTWLGRMPSIILANRIMQTLYHLDRSNENYYLERMVNTVQDIQDVFNELEIILAPLKGRSVFVYHPSFGYFLDEFGIEQEAVETGGKEPTPRELNNLISKITSEQPAAIFVQTQFPVNAARTIAGAVGADVIELDPLAQNWLENIRYIGEALKRTVR